MLGISTDVCRLGSGKEYTTRKKKRKLAAKKVVGKALSLLLKMTLVKIFVAANIRVADNTICHR